MIVQFERIKAKQSTNLNLDHLANDDQNDKS